MKNQEIKKRKQEIFDTIAELNEELKTIRSSCSHDDYKIGNYSWRLGSSHLKRICEYCGDCIGDPSADEMIKFNQEQEIIKQEFINKQSNNGKV